MIATLVLVILGLIASVIVNLVQFTKNGNVSERIYLKDKEHAIIMQRREFELDKKYSDKFDKEELTHSARVLSRSTEIAELEARIDSLKLQYEGNYAAKYKAQEDVLSNQNAEIKNLREIINTLIINQPKQIIGIPLPVPEAAPGNGRR